MTPHTNLAPGPELNAAVAREVFGCKPKAFKHLDRGVEYACTCPGQPHARDRIVTNLKPYSERIDYAWEVVEKLRPHLMVGIQPFGDNYHVEVMGFRPPGMNTVARASAPTAPHAIALAARKAVRS